MAVDYALTNKARVKTRLGITTSGFDTFIDTLINSVTDFIEAYCGGRRFLRTAYTNEIYNGSFINDTSTRPRYLVLNNAPVTTLSSIQYRSGAKSNPAWNTYNADDYEEQNSLGIIEIHGGLPYGQQNLRVNYTAGYLIDFDNYDDRDQHTLPYELTDLAERLVVRFFKRRESEGKTQENYQDSSFSWSQELDVLDRTILQNYRRFISA